MCGVHYRVRSIKVKCERWYPTRAQAIAAFESKCKRVGIPPPECYPPGASGDSITTGLAYPRRICAAGLREGHDWVCVDTRNDLLPR